MATEARKASYGATDDPSPHLVSSVTMIPENSSNINQNMNNQQTQPARKFKDTNFNMVVIKNVIASIILCSVTVMVTLFIEHTFFKPTYNKMLSQFRSKGKELLAEQFTESLPVCLDSANTPTACLKLWDVYETDKAQINTTVKTNTNTNLERNTKKL